MAVGQDAIQASLCQPSSNSSDKSIPTHLNTSKLIEVGPLDSSKDRMRAVSHPPRKSYGLAGLGGLAWNKTSLETLRCDFAPVIPLDSGAAVSKSDKELIRFFDAQLHHYQQRRKSSSPFQIHQQRPRLGSGARKAIKTIEGLGIISIISKMKNK